MLDKYINNHFKVSNDPNLIGWNPTMSIQLILAQLGASYGKPSKQLMWNNVKVFQTDFLSNNAQELLFHYVEQCQEVAIIARNPYTPTQLITNTMHLLLQSKIFPMKEFEDWEATPNKTWLALKIFIHGVYTWHLVAVGLQSTLAQQGYVPAHNMYNILGAGGNNTADKSTAVTITQTTAAATTGSTLANTYATPAPAPTYPQITSAINSLSANQQALYQHIAPLSQQMAAMSFNTQPPTPRCTFTAPHLTPFNVPPIQQLSIPAPLPFNAGGFNNGHRGRSTGGLGHGRRFNQRSRGHNPFADNMAACGSGLQGGVGANNMFPKASGFQTVNAQCMNPQYSI
jgi:hypothetical protein